MAGGRKIRYVRDIPFKKRREICSDLDSSGAWQALAGELKIPTQRVRVYGLALQRPGGSPTDELLMEWSHKNATVLQLFKAFQKLKMVDMMGIIKDYVDREVYLQAMRDLGADLSSDEEEEDAASPPKYTDVAHMGQAGHHGFSLLPPQFNQPSQPAQPPYLPVQPSLYQLPNYQPNHGLPGPPQRLYNPMPQDLEVAQRPQNFGADRPPLQPMQQNFVPHQEPVESIDEQAYSQVNYHEKVSRYLDTQVPTENSNNYHGGSSRSTPSSAPCVPLRVDSLHNQTINQNQKIYNRTESNTSGNTSSTSFSSVMKFEYEDVTKGTFGFDQDQILGRGGFGEVYKGYIKNTYFAIKKLSQKFSMTDEQRGPNPKSEVDALQKYKHENIIQLIGYSYCDRSEILCLLYEYMVNGSLEDRLACKGNTPPLPWYTRHSIMVGASRAIQYLHSVAAKPLIHGDIKSANILLDRHWGAKVCDFGLAKEATGGSKPNVYTHNTRNEMEKLVFGSKGYIPPEFIEDGCNISIHMDKYSFGVVLFETCTGEPAYDDIREGHILLTKKVHSMYNGLNSHYSRDPDKERKLLNLRDRNCPDWPSKTWLDLLDIGKQLTSELKVDRPNLTEVLHNLEKINGEVGQLFAQQARQQGQHVISGPPSQGSVRSARFSFESQGQGYSLHGENLNPLPVSHGQMQQNYPVPHGALEQQMGQLDLKSIVHLQHQPSIEKISGLRNITEESEDIYSANLTQECPPKSSTFDGEGDLLDHSLKEDPPVQDYSADDPRWLIYDKSKLYEEYEKPVPRPVEDSVPFQLQQSFDKKKMEEEHRLHLELDQMHIGQEQSKPSKDTLDVCVPLSSSSKIFAHHTYENVQIGTKPEDDLDAQIPSSDSLQATGPIYHNIYHGQVRLDIAPMKQDTEIIQNDANLQREILESKLATKEQPHLFVPVDSSGKSPPSDDNFEISNPDEASDSDDRSFGAHINLDKQQAVEISGPISGELSMGSDEDNARSGNYDSLEALKNKGLPSFMSFLEAEDSELENINAFKLEQGQIQAHSHANSELLKNMDAVKMCDRFASPGEHEQFQNAMQVSPKLYDEIQQNLDVRYQSRGQSGPPTPTRSTPSTPTYALPIYSSQNKAQIVFEPGTKCNSIP